MTTTRFSADMRLAGADSTPLAPELPQVDIYGLVHKGLRWSLCNLLTRMATHDPADADNLQMALDDLEGLLYMCLSHGTHEDRHLHPAIEVRRPGGAAFLHATHDELEREMALLRELSQQLAAASEASVPSLWRALYVRYSAFVGRNLLHMAEEELRSQALLDELYSVREQQSIHTNLLRSIGPEEKLAFLRAMLNGANPAERLRLLDMAHEQLPVEVWSSVLLGIRSQVSETERRQIEQRYGSLA
jgi:hypothetical protein